MDLNIRKVTEFEDEKVKENPQFIKENKNDFKTEKLKFLKKLKK